MTSARRVRRLHLKAAAPSDVTQARVLIEDALRTASLPGLPVSGLVLIRRLNLGHFNVSESATGVSRQIDQRIVSIQPVHICTGDEEQPEASAVFFSDSVSPWVLYAGLLIKGTVPVSWYWPLALPQAAISPAEPATAPQLLVAASTADYPLHLVSALMQQWVDAGYVDRLFAQLTAQVSRRILDNMGVRCDGSPADHSDTGISSRLDALPVPGAKVSSWKSLLQDWVSRLGVDDGRAGLLAFTAAAKLHFPAASTLASAVLHSVASEAIYPKSRTWQPLDAAQLVHGYPVIDRNASLNARPALAGPVGDSPQCPVSSGNESKPVLLADTSLRNLGNDTIHAGFLFLVNVLQRLGIDQTLEQFEELAHCCMPLQILNNCATRLSIAPEDAVLKCLGPLNVLPEEKRISQYVAPYFWLDLLFAPHRSTNLLLYEESDEVGKRHLLTDASGCIVLALWRGAMPQAVCELVRERGTAQVAVPPLKNDLQLISQSYRFAMGRYLRRYGKTAIKQATTKVGQIDMTRTHVDVVLPLSEADLGVRKAGADIDPGWVPWLGRVLTFHYRDDER